MNENSPPERVENAKLTLYAFHLCHDMTLGEQQRVEDSDRLWHTFAKLGQELGIKSLATCYQWLNPSEDGRTVNFRELLSEEIGRCLRFPIPYEDFRGLNSPNPPSRRNGELYALQIHDTYAADLTFRYTAPISLNQLSHLNSQGVMLPDRIQASLGQTLVLFAKPLTNENNLNPETLRSFADQCLEALLRESKQHFQNVSYLAQGELLGSPIFEYDNLAEDPAQSCHILIWLDCHPDTTRLEADGDYYHPLLNLLCYRSKIRFSYHQARTRNRDARKIYHELETVMQGLQNLPEDTAELLTVLKRSLVQTNPKAFTYASYVRDIKDHRTAIITNLRNYTTSLEQLKQLEGKNELTFLQLFSERRSKLLGQIHTDLNYLMPGKDLFGHCISTMRAIIEVEQTEIDNKRQQADIHLQDHIQAIGVGIAAGAFVASSSGLMLEPWSLPNRHQWIKSPHPLFLAILSSSLIAIGAWWIAKEWIKKMRSR